MFRPFRKATVIALSAAAVGVLALATPAQAARIGSVTTSSYDEGAALGKCQAAYPKAKSADLEDMGVDENGGYYYIWDCYDTMA